MTAPVDGGEREAVRTARLANHMSIDVPLAQWERAKVLLAVPLERESPRLVPNPVAYPVIRPDVDEHAHLAREQRADVVHRAVEAVPGRVERLSDSTRTGREPFGYVLVNSKFRADIWAIKEVRYVPKRESVQPLRNSMGAVDDVRNYWVT